MQNSCFENNGKGKQKVKSNYQALEMYPGDFSQVKEKWTTASHGVKVKC